MTFTVLYHDCYSSKITALQTLIPMTDTRAIQSYTARSGDRVDLHCPMQPGALLQHHSVIWTKDGDEIANSHSIRKSNSRYNIDRATYALIIEPVNENDTSSSYNCQVYVTNPITDTKQQLQYYPQLAPGVQLSLTVSELIYSTAATTELTGDSTLSVAADIVPVNPTTEYQTPTSSEEPTEDSLVNFWCTCKCKKQLVQEP